MESENLNGKLVNCKVCMWEEQCAKDSEWNSGMASRCAYFDIVDESHFEDVILPYLREITPCSNEKKLTRRAVKNRAVCYEDGKYSLDEYYVGMINDSLFEMRHGRTIYVFNLNQVVEILRFEPDANITLHDGIFYINLSK